MAGIHREARMAPRLGLDNFLWPRAEEDLTVTGQMQVVLTGTDLLPSEIRLRHPFGSDQNGRSVFNG